MMTTPIVVFGISYKTAPIELLERLSIGSGRLPKALDQLMNYQHVVEGVVVSTCNRTEVYAAVSRYHGGVGDLRNFLSEFCHVAPEDFADHVYAYYDETSVRHLFRVASGIDSMIIGETEILGQVRRAFQVADEQQAAQRVLGPVFQSALRIGRRARTETAISKNPASMSSAALGLARRTLGDLRGRRVAVVGAGEMGRLTTRALARVGAAEVTVVNRTAERGEAVADELAVSFKPMDELAGVIAGADVVVFSTTATESVADEDLVRAAMGGSDANGHTPKVIIDMAVPRDVEPGVARVPGVLLYDISDLQGIVESSVGGRLEEVANVEHIIESELERFMSWESAVDIAPTVSALLAAAEDVRQSEMVRLAAGANLSPAQRDEVERATKRIVSKLLHPPLRRAKDLSASKQGYVYLNAIRELFGLGDRR